MTDTPEALRGIYFLVYATTANFQAFARHVLGAIETCGLPAIDRWDDATMDELGKGQDLEAALARLPETAAAAGDTRHYVHVYSGETLRGVVKFECEWGDGSLSLLRLNWTGVHRDLPGTIAFQQACAKLCADLMQHFPIYSAELWPDGGGASCLPEVPLVTKNSHIAVTNSVEGEQLYDDPGVFWNADWTRMAEIGGQVLLARALDQVAGASYLTQIIAPQWDMARAAKPGATSYPELFVRPEEKEIFGSGEPRLTFVGYSQAERLAEYSCVLEKGMHIQGWEIFALRDMVAKKAMPEGHPVDTVRVVFMDDWAARAEKRPLLDIGCRVFHYDADGELRELTE